MWSAVDPAHPPSAVIYGLSGPVLSDEEHRFFSQANPLGFILFARNCVDKAQLSALTAALRDSVGRNCPILIDQEGGRVQRLKAPVWTDYPAAQSFGIMARRDEAGAAAALAEHTARIAAELAESGVDVNCAPVLDLALRETHEVIGDRSFSGIPDLVGKFGIVSCETHIHSGITPIIKHIPGHGRARADSHKELPVVKASIEDLAEDFLPFRTVAQSRVAPAVWAMTAHVVYTAIDERRPASLSEKVIAEAVRGWIGFEGVLVSDDLDMLALRDFGGVPERALGVLAAGCDVALHCSGDLEMMKRLAWKVPQLTEKSVERLNLAAESAKVLA